MLAVVLTVIAFVWQGLHVWGAECGDICSECAFGCCPGKPGCCADFSKFPNCGGCGVDRCNAPPECYDTKDAYCDSKSFGCIYPVMLDDGTLCAGGEGSCKDGYCNRCPDCDPPRECELLTCERGGDCLYTRMPFGAQCDQRLGAVCDREGNCDRSCIGLGCNLDFKRECDVASKCTGTCVYGNLHLDDGDVCRDRLVKPGACAATDCRSCVSFGCRPPAQAECNVLSCPDHKCAITPQPDGYPCAGWMSVCRGGVCRDFSCVDTECRERECMVRSGCEDDRCLYLPAVAGVECGPRNGGCDGMGACDLCFWEPCTTPPDCYRGSGVCESESGACRYSDYADAGTACGVGGICDGAGTCQGGGDPCAGVSCTSPPVCRLAPGECQAGSGLCDYPALAPAGATCQGSGACTASGTCDMCATVTCNSPPECRVLAGWSCAPATGVCSYPNWQGNGVGCGLTANGGCQNGACSQCFHANCVAPPVCRSSPGVCNPSTGVCGYAGLAPVGSACQTIGGCTAAGNCDLCYFASCTSPPVCRTSPGSCNTMTGSCAYATLAPVGTACQTSGGCTAAGTCDMCYFVVPCAAPPVCRTTVGASCTAGVCAYPTNATDGAACPAGGGCRRGVCDPCYFTTCASPPACRTAPGVCSAGICAYPTFAAVGATCQGSGACTAGGTCDMCATVVCNNPGICQFQTGSSCANGVCTYPINATDGTACPGGGGCRRGLCDLCYFAACTAPPVCRASPGVCSAMTGLCAYPTFAMVGAVCQTSGGCTAGGTCDMCYSVTCTSPPVCRNTTAALCTNGVCAYPTNATDGTACPSGGGCRKGVCDLCYFTACTAPPTCRASPGVCSAGSCAYPGLAAVGSACQTSGGCTAGGSCDLCFFTNCSAPGVCQVSAGALCANGVCSYFNATDGASCPGGGGCRKGVCDRCYFTSCAAPPVCRQSPGVCSAVTGLCSYPALANVGTVCQTSGGCTAGGLCDMCYYTTCLAPPVCRNATGATCAGGTCTYANATDGAACAGGGGCRKGVCDLCYFAACTSPPACRQSPGVCSPSTGLCAYPALAAVGATCQGVGSGCNATGDCDLCYAVTCNSPPTCRTASGASCALGVCAYPVAVAGTACGAGSTCAANGTCLGNPCLGVTCTAPPTCKANGTCVGGACNYPDAPLGTPCPGGAGNGGCVNGACDQCNRAVCTSPPVCRQSPGTCTPGVGTCTYGGLAAVGATCQGSGGCNSTGHCDMCYAVSCTTPPACRLAPGVCSPINGMCTYATLAAPGVGCTSAGRPGSCNALGACDLCANVSCTSAPLCRDNPGQCAAGLCAYPTLSALGTTCQGVGSGCNATGGCDLCYAVSCASPPTCRAAPGVCARSTGVCTYASLAGVGSACSSGGFTGGCTAAGVCDLCYNVACTVPPVCKAATTCATATGACNYPNLANGTPCGAQGGKCNNGMCDLCYGATCASPGVCRTGPGVCSPLFGNCSYALAAAGSACLAGLGKCDTNGVCDLCANVTCTPVPVCRQPTTCQPSTGSCNWPLVVAGTVCAGGKCDSLGNCDPCYGVVCNAPPSCKAAPGVCSSGVCTYPNAVSGTLCSTGQCNGAGACVSGCSGVPPGLPVNATGTISGAGCVAAFTVSGASCSFACLSGFSAAGNFRCESTTWVASNAPTPICADVNECATANGGCAQLCANYPGSRSCACGANYTGSGSPANSVCTGRSCTFNPLPVAQGTFAANCNPTPSGGWCNLTCAVGTTKSSDALCTAGVWSTPVCSGTPCTVLPSAPSFGTYAACVPRPNGGSCALTCQTGYTKSGDALCVGGSWQTPLPVCTPNACVRLFTPPAHGTLGTCGSAVAHGASCSFTCTYPYTLQGSARTCSAGTLGGVDQTCINTTPPQMVSAQFASTIMDISIVFAYPIALAPGLASLANPPTSALCAALFTANSLVLLQGSATPAQPALCGVDPTAKLITITASPTGTILPANQFLTFRANVVYNDESRVALAPVPFQVALGPNPRAPTPQISGPSEASLCTTVVFDGSLSLGSLGRSLAYQWSIDYLTVAGVAGNGSTLTFPPGASVTLHVITLTVTNAFGLTRSESMQLNVRIFPIPSIVIDAPRVITRDQDVFLSPAITLAPCDVSINPVYSFTWSLAQGPAVDFTPCASSTCRLTNRIFRIPAGLVGSGNTYTFALTLQTISAQYGTVETLAYANSIFVEISDVVAYISGGDRTVSTGAALVLDGSQSRDPDLFGYSATAILSYVSYSWSCIRVEDAEPIVLHPAVNLNQAQLILPSAYLPPANIYVFVLTFSSTGGGWLRSASASRTITVTTLSVPTVLLFGPATINRANVLRLEGSVNSTLPVQSYTLSYAWAELSRGLDLTDPAVRLSAFNSPNLVLAAEVLLTGVSYTFQLTVTQTGPLISTVSVSASTAVYVNQPPVAGSCAISPLAADAFTGFTFTCMNWVDDSGLPVTYSFYSSSSLYSTPQSLSLAQISNQFTSLLPVGVNTPSVAVCDADGGCATVMLPSVNVTLRTGGGSGQCMVQNITTGALAAAQALHDQNQLFALIRLLLVLLDQDSFVHANPELPLVCNGVTLADTFTSFRAQLWDVFLTELATIARNDTFTPSTAQQMADIMVELVKSITAELQSAHGVDNRIVVILSLLTRIIDSVSSSSVVVSAVMNVLSTLLETVSCADFPLVSNLMQLLAYRASTGAVDSETVTIQGGQISADVVRLAGDAASSSVPQLDDLQITLSDQALQRSGGAFVDLTIVRFSEAIRRCRQSLSNRAVKFGGQIISIDLSAGQLVASNITGLDEPITFYLPVDNVDLTCVSPECSWWNEDASEWSTAGCSTVSGVTTLGSSGQAVVLCCNHLTDFAVLLRETPCGTHEPQQYFFAAVYILLATVAATQIVRQQYADHLLGIRLFSYSAILLQHALIFFASLFRFFNSLRMAGAITMAIVPTGIVAALPYCFLFWIFTLLMFQWASIFHLSMKQGAKQAFAAVRPWFLGSNLTAVLVVFFLFISIVSDSFADKRKVALGGSIVMFFLYIICGVGFFIYGYALSRTLMQKPGGHKRDKPRRQNTNSSVPRSEERPVSAAANANANVNALQPGSPAATPPLSRAGSQAGPLASPASSASEEGVENQPAAAANGGSACDRMRGYCHGCSYSQLSMGHKMLLIACVVMVCFVTQAVLWVASVADLPSDSSGAGHSSNYSTAFACFDILSLIAVLVLFSAGVTKRNTANRDKDPEHDSAAGSPTHKLARSPSSRLNNSSGPASRGERGSSGLGRDKDKDAEELIELPSPSSRHGAIPHSGRKKTNSSAQNSAVASNNSGISHSGSARRFNFGAEGEGKQRTDSSHKKKPGDVSRTCDECDSLASEVWCAVCQQALCSRCSTVIHKTGSRKAHTVTSLPRDNGSLADPLMPTDEEEGVPSPRLASPERDVETGADDETVA